ncbi:MAG: hypothetical protein ACRD3I_14220, partial [Terriglobales bacterium]
MEPTAAFRPVGKEADMVMAYTVPKLADYSQAELDRAVAELLSALDSEAAQVSGDAQWKAFRDRWMARKNGLFTQINDVWLRTAPTERKPEVGRRVNELKTRIEDVLNATLHGLFELKTEPK